jgi:hypothetical protein
VNMLPMSRKPGEELRLLLGLSPGTIDSSKYLLLRP